jgi:hypothetical protein
MQNDEMDMRLLAYFCTCFAAIIFILIIYNQYSWKRRIN